MLNKIRSFISTSTTIDPYEVFGVIDCVDDDLVRVGEGEKQFQKEKSP